jgi:putative transposase
VPLVLRRHAAEPRPELRVDHALGVLGDLRHRVESGEVGVAPRRAQPRTGVQVARVAALVPPTAEGAEESVHEARFRCRDCQRAFNERTGTPFNRLQYPTDVICLVVLWRFRYKLSLRDLAEMFLQRGIIFTHEAARDWEIKLTPQLTKALRKKRRGAVGNSWYVDETYIKVQGQWCDLYRAIDRDGTLVDTRLSDTRDLAAAAAFFRAAWMVAGRTPDRITTDGHDAYPRAIRNVFGDRVTHRTKRYLNNHLEPDHRGVKQRYRPMCGFKAFATAARFCCIFDEIRAFLRPQSHRNQFLSLKQRRAIHQEQFAHLLEMMAVA